MTDKSNPFYVVYLLRCSDGSLYTGSTPDLAKRIAIHNAGKGAKYTRGRLPVEVVYQENLPSKSDALKREIALKKLTRTAKLQLIKTSHNI